MVKASAGPQWSTTDLTLFVVPQGKREKHKCEREERKDKGRERGDDGCFGHVQGQRRWVGVVPTTCSNNGGEGRG